MALAYAKKCNWFAGRRRLVAQPGGLDVGLAVYPVFEMYLRALRLCYFTGHVRYTSSFCVNIFRQTVDLHRIILIGLL